MIKFSIIIPHYNIPDLLIRCLKSIPIRDDIQVIVVDDNSSDADTYLERYPELSRPNLEFIRTSEGKGAGYARNVGIDHAKGKWLLFADADDFYVDNVYDLINIHYNSDADVIYFKTRSVYSCDITKTSTREYSYNKLVDSFLTNNDQMSIRVRYGVPWGKMIRKSLVDRFQLRFEEVKYSNDQYFSVCVGIYAKSIDADGAILYVATNREGSSTYGYKNGNPKPHELEIRASVNYRIQLLLRENDIYVTPMPMRYWLLMLLKFDRLLYKKYFKDIRSIYPSKMCAIRDLAYGLVFYRKVYIYIYTIFFC